MKFGTTIWEDFYRIVSEFFSVTTSHMLKEPGNMNG